MLEEYLARARSNDLLRSATSPAASARRQAQAVNAALDELYDGAALDRRDVDPGLFDRYYWSGLHLI
jgi:hypothetical protein